MPRNLTSSSQTLEDCMKINAVFFSFYYGDQLKAYHEEHGCFLPFNAWNLLSKIVLLLKNVILELLLLTEFVQMPTVKILVCMNIMVTE
jgi:hypothetical protein